MHMANAVWLTGDRFTAHTCCNMSRNQWNERCTAADDICPVMTQLLGSRDGARAAITGVSCRVLGRAMCWLQAVTLQCILH
jgi:hypothetical protein